MKGAVSEFLNLKSKGWQNRLNIWFPIPRILVWKRIVVARYGQVVILEPPFRLVCRACFNFVRIIKGRRLTERNKTQSPGQQLLEPDYLFHALQVQLYHVQLSMEVLWTSEVCWSQCAFPEASALWAIVVFVEKPRIVSKIMASSSISGTSVVVVAVVVISWLVSGHSDRKEWFCTIWRLPPRFYWQNSNNQQYKSQTSKLPCWRCQLFVFVSCEVWMTKCIFQTFKLQSETP